MDIGLCSHLGMGSPGLVFWQRGQRLCSNLGMGSPAPACLLVAWARNGYVDVPYPSPNKNKTKKIVAHTAERQPPIGCVCLATVFIKLLQYAKAYSYFSAKISLAGSSDFFAGSSDF